MNVITYSELHSNKVKLILVFCWSLNPEELYSLKYILGGPGKSIHSLSREYYED